MTAPQIADQSTREPEVLDVYIDSASARVSPWTVLIEFGKQRMPASGESDPQLLARIRMSPQHAKATALMLSRIMEQYEAKNGPIELRNISLEEDTVDENIEEASHD